MARRKQNLVEQKRGKVRLDPAFFRFAITSGGPSCVITFRARARDHRFAADDLSQRDVTPENKKQIQEKINFHLNRADAYEFIADMIESGRPTVAT